MIAGALDPIAPSRLGRYRGGMALTPELKLDLARGLAGIGGILLGIGVLDSNVVVAVLGGGGLLSAFVLWIKDDRRLHGGGEE